MKAIPTDVYDKEGNMLRIDFHDGAGDFILQFIWDENDAQTSEKRIAFREWAYKWMRDRDYEVLK